MPPPWPSTSRRSRRGWTSRTRGSPSAGDRHGACTLRGSGGERMATATTVSTSKVAGRLNSLLRGEISAVETYTQAAKKIEDGRAAEAALLREIEREHGRNAQLLRDEVKRLGGEADNSSGAW